MAGLGCGGGRLWVALWWGGSVVLLAAVACAAQRGQAQEGPAEPGGKLAAASRLGAAAAKGLTKGQRPTSAAAQRRRAGQASATDDPLSTSSEGLVEVPGLTPAGGTSVDLQGRFRRTLILHRAADGTVSEECTADLPAAGRRD